MPGAESTWKRVARRVRFRAVSWVEKVLQNTGPAEFRQSGFLDFPRTPGYNFWFLTPGGVAQLGERLNGIQEVRGSIPLASIRRNRSAAPRHQSQAVCSGVTGSTTPDPVLTARPGNARE